MNYLVVSNNTVCEVRAGLANKTGPTRIESLPEMEGNIIEVSAGFGRWTVERLPDSGDVRVTRYAGSGRVTYRKRIGYGIYVFSPINNEPVKFKDWLGDKTTIDRERIPLGQSTEYEVFGKDTYKGQSPESVREEEEARKLLRQLDKLLMELADNKYVGPLVRGERVSYWLFSAAYRAEKKVEGWKKLVTSSPYYYEP